MNEIQNPTGMKTFGVPEDSKRLSSSGDTEKSTFSDKLSHAIDSVNEMQLEKDRAVEDFSAGRVSDIHSTMITVEKAQISFQLMMAVTNKIRKAYEEIRNMQV